MTNKTTQWVKFADLDPATQERLLTRPNETAVHLEPVLVKSTGDGEVAGVMHIQVGEVHLVMTAAEFRSLGGAMVDASMEMMTALYNESGKGVPH